MLHWCLTRKMHPDNAAVEGGVLKVKENDFRNVLLLTVLLWGM